jgi:hypothetical protein
MKNIKEIGNELREISPLVANISREEGPYTVPAGYFESFADRVMTLIGEGKKNEIPGESAEVLPLIAGLDRSGPYQVPEGYFESFAETLMDRIMAVNSGTAAEELQLLSPLLGSLEKKTPYELPSGYFHELSTNLAAGLKAVDFVKDELEDIPACLQDFDRVNPYSIPEGYFDHLPDAVLDRVKIRRPAARVVAFGGVRKSWRKYAVAASLVGIIFTGGLLYFHRSARAAEDPLAGLSKVSDQEILNYLENEENPLAGSTTIPNNTIASVDDFSDSDVNDLLSEVPDNELQQYANDHLGAKEETTN